MDRDDELQAIEAAVAAGRCHKITVAETIEHDDEQDRRRAADPRAAMRAKIRGGAAAYRGRHLLTVRR